MILQTKKNTKHRLLTIDYIFKQNHMDKKKRISEKEERKLETKKAEGKAEKNSTL